MTEIIPVTWMKRDRCKLYEFLLGYPSKIFPSNSLTNNNKKKQEKKTNYIRL